MNKILIGAIVVILFAGGIYFFTQQSAPPEESEQMEVAEEAMEMEQEGEMAMEEEEEATMMASLEEYNYELDTEESTFEWAGRKAIGDEHFGTVEIESGQVLADGTDVQEAVFIMDMTTITATDGDNAAMQERLAGHLKADDFFGVEEYPTAMLRVTEVEEIPDAEAGEPNYTVMADLTIKDITEGIEFPAKITEEEDGNVTATAEFSIDRTLWDVRFGSGKFFDDLGDNLIEDEFDVTVNLVFVPTGE